MSDRALDLLARTAGLAVTWTDVQGRSMRVTPDTLRTVLDALGLSAGSGAQISASLARLREMAAQSPALSVVRCNGQLSVPGWNKHGRWTSDNGDLQDVRRDDGGAFRVPSRPGFYRLEAGNRAFAIAAVPRQARLMDTVSGEKSWGVAAQVYALRGGSTPEFGDFAALAEFACSAARAGADAVAVSPVHALFSADPSRYSPYAPSTRLFLNPLYVATKNARARTAPAQLIDWPRAAKRKMRTLRESYARFLQDSRLHPDFAEYVRSGGPQLLAHARFECLDARFRREGLNRWQDWAAAYRAARSAAVRRLKPSDPEVEFHLYLQWLADRSLAQAQASSRSAGMAVGLISDIAVGVDPNGSQSWASQGEFLTGLSVGAPPDYFSAAGQNWGITTFSPLGLRESGFGGFIGALRCAMRNAGAIRIDHAMGLQRLWIVPHGASATDGVYLTYPLSALMGLIALESIRNNCIVIAEDLGTVPNGFRQKIAATGIYGMRVLWFERDSKGNFVPPEKWETNAVALSTTHDLPTVAGWWCGNDIAWRKRLSGKAQGWQRQENARFAEKKKLWTALKRDRCVSGGMPRPRQSSRVVTDALKYLARTRSSLVLVPVEDLIGEREQPNLPGTIDEHPNWRRRHPRRAVFSNRQAQFRAAILTAYRAR